MNKTISINISGLIFNIEEEAYEILRKYLEDIKSYFEDTEECREIMDDIESRIAELFTAKLSESKTVIGTDDVQDVIKIMGNPEEYVDDSDEEHKEQKQTKKQFHKSKTRRMYRDPDNKVLGGICSGISNYFGWDPIWLRIALILFTMAFGSGVFIYIVLWLILPKAVTNAQKLEMKGETVNVENIGKMASEGGEKVKQGFDKFKKKLDEVDTSNLSDQLEKIILTLIEIIKGALKLVVKFVGVGFILASVIILVVLLSFLIGQFPFSLFSDESNISVYQFGKLFFTSPIYLNIATIGALLLTIVPLMLILYLGVKLLFNFKDNFKNVALVLVGLWILGVITMSIIGISTGTEFASEKKIKESITLDSLKSDTLYLDVFNDEYFSNHLNSHDDFLGLIAENDDSIIVGSLDLNIKKSATPFFMLEIQRIASGPTQKEAILRTENIHYSYLHRDSLIVFKPYFSFSEDDKYRGQQIRITVRVPEGKAVYLSENMKRIIYDIDNVTNTLDKYMVGKTWTMTDQGLDCVDCSLKRQKTSYKYRRNRKIQHINIEINED